MPQMMPHMWLIMIMFIYSIMISLMSMMYFTSQFSPMPYFIQYKEKMTWNWKW